MIEKIKAMLGEDYEVKEVQVNKNNGIVMNGISITCPGVNISPTFYYDGSVSKDDFINSVVNNVKSNKFLAGGFDSSIFNDKEKFLSNVIPALVNGARNEDKFDDVVSKDFLDLKIIYKVIFSEGMTGAATVKGDLINRLGITEQELHERAMINLRNNIYRKSMSELIIEMMGEEGFEFSTDEDDPTIIISNQNRYYGAGAMLCLSDILSGRFYIIPSSVHEIICFPCDENNVDVDYLKNMVLEVNATEISELDFLSNSVYMLDNGKIEVVA